MAGNSPDLALPGRNLQTQEDPRPFTLEEFGSIDTKSKRPAIAPKDFYWIENWMPIGPGNMRTLWGEEATPIYTTSNPRTIIHYDFYNIASTRYCAVFLDDGTAVQVNTATLATTTISASANKFYTAGGTQPATCQYQSKYLSIASQVAADAYWVWDGASLFGPGTLAPDVTLTNSGLSYASAPTVTAFGGSGSGATFTATVSNNSVTDVKVTSPGSGWVKGELVTLIFSGGGSDTQARATATVVTSSGGVAIVTVTNGGSGYSKPLVTFSGGGGSGAKAFVSGAANGVVTEITVTDPGSGYTSNPAVAVADSGGGTGSGATAVCEIRRGQVTAITVNSGGSGYTGVPDVQISAPNDFGFPNIQAEAYATISAGAVTAITMTVMGVGYKSAAVDLAGGNNSAQATIKLMPYGIKGTSIETYQNRIWVATDTKFSYTAAGSVADFSGISGGGSSPATDAFLREKIVRMMQANGFLYYFGDSSINVISNVQTSSLGVTSFNNSNVDPQIGSAWRDSIRSFGRALVFANPTGVYALYGGAAEKVSGPLDGLFQKANFTTGVTPSACVATIFSIRVYCLLMTTTDPTTGIERPMMLMWDGQRWFVGSQGFTLNDLAGQEINSILTGYGASTTKIARLFQTPSASLSKRFKTKLVSPTSYILSSTAYHVYFMAQTETTVGGPVNISLVNEQGSNPVVATDVSAQATWTNNSGAVCTWSGLAGAAASFSSKGLVVKMYDDSQYGQLLGADVDTLVPDMTFISMTLLLKDYSPNG